jgi:hypothetical protein
VLDDDMRHAVEHALAVEDVGEDPDRWLAIGPDRAGNLTHGHTKSGPRITDEMVEQLADEAERGYDVDALVARRGKRGRPRLGSEPSTVESVRLDPDLKALLVRRAEDEGVPVSEVIREALREHLKAS